VAHYLCLVLREGLARDLAFHLRNDAIGLRLCRAPAAVRNGACRYSSSGNQVKSAMAIISRGKQRRGGEAIRCLSGYLLRKLDDR